MSIPRVLGIIPARGGSKGIKQKNLRVICGRSLVGWSAKALNEATSIDFKMCNTDDQSIATNALMNGLEVPFIRPPELAQDETLIVDVLSHNLRQLEAGGHGVFTHVALVQATSPTVLAEDIDGAVALALREQADTVITGCHAGQRHPSTMYKTGSNNRVNWLFNEKKRMMRRQDFSAIFVRTGLVYIIATKLILEQRTIYGDKICAYEISEDRAITVDTEQDLLVAEQILKRMSTSGI